VDSVAGDADMYDLTVDGFHTYYVAAGDQPVLVHNCSQADAAGAYEAAQRLQDLRHDATNDYGVAGYHGTTSVIAVFNAVTGRIHMRTGINGNGEAPNSWPQWAQDGFVRTNDGSHAEEGILNDLAPEEFVMWGASSRGLCWGRCHPRLSGDPNIEVGGPEYGADPAKNSPWRMFWRICGCDSGH
jgi:hypothetical protein